MQESVQLPQDSFQRMAVKPVIWTRDLVTRFWDGLAQTRLLDKMSFAALAGEQCLEVFSPFLDKNKSYIDFGGGDGHLAKVLCAQGYRVASYDISEGRERRASEVLSEYSETFLGQVSPGGGQKFAGVFFLEVAEHVLDEDVASTYQAIYDFLEPGGLLFLTTPNQEDLELGLTAEPRSGALFHRWQHVRTFNRGSLTLMLKPFGLNEVLIHEIDFGKEVFAAVKKATAGVDNIFDAKRPVYFSSRPNLVGIFSKGECSFEVDKVPCLVSTRIVADVSPDVLLGSPSGWPALTLPTGWITREGGACFACALETVELWDDVDHPAASVIRLYEDGRQLGPPHASLDEIRESGACRYSHWQGTLYFSSSDGSDPRVKGRRYEVRAPAQTLRFGASNDWPAIILPTASITQEGGSCFVCDLETVELRDDVDHPAASVIHVYENGLLLGPPHASHDEIRRSGGGRYSHWKGRLYFSSSDGSDPRVNGRRYEVRAPVRTRG
jgi:2-polyprenyl-3-methyl-5-hydroxy-6-metoxy-1,4-benzoquinol methylase